MSPATIHKITKLVGRPRRDCIYDIIGYLDLDLCVDVGAAAGDVTRRLRHLGGRHTRVVAFEPFPGNHGFFYDSIRELQDVELVKKAVTDRIGRASFTVPSVVQGTEQGWEKRAGYSSVGFLSDVSSPAVGVGQSLRGLDDGFWTRCSSRHHARRWSLIPPASIRSSPGRGSIS